MKPLFLTLTICLFAVTAQAQEITKETIKIGGIYSISAMPYFMKPSVKGAEMAVEEINAKGGIMGRPLELIIRDDRGSVSDGVQVAEELYHRYNIDALIGTPFSTFALSDFAKRNKLPYFAAWGGSNKMTWQNFHPYVFTIEEVPLISAKSLAKRAAELSANRWATIALEGDYGRSMVNTFLELLKERKPGIEIVAQYWPKHGELDAGATIQALHHTDPEAVFIILHGSDLVKYLRESRKRDVLLDLPHFHPYLGTPENLEVLGDEVPIGWHVLGYPAGQLENPALQKFDVNYRKRHGETPGLGSLLGYVNVNLLSEAIRRAGSTDPKKVVAVAEGMRIATPVGGVKFRAIDHRSTLGYWYGRTALQDGNPVMVDFEQNDVEALSPPDEWICEQRPNCNPEELKE